MTENKLLWRQNDSQGEDPINDLRGKTIPEIVNHVHRALRIGSLTDVLVSVDLSKELRKAFENRSLEVWKINSGFEVSNNERAICVWEATNECDYCSQPIIHVLLENYSDTHFLCEHHFLVERLKGALTLDEY